MPTQPQKHYELWRTLLDRRNGEKLPGNRQKKMSQITPSELVTKLAKAGSKVVSEVEAEYFAKEVVEVHIRKYPRTNPLDSAIKDIQACLDNRDESIKYAVDLPAYLAIDFNGQGPLPYIKKIHDEIENRANNSGLVMVSLTNSKAMHTLHDWVQGLAKRGLLAIAICNGWSIGRSTLQRHEGSIRDKPGRLWHSRPKTAPSTGVDMATSEIPYLKSSMPTKIMNHSKSVQP
jgi:hypothetical protein